MNRSQRPEAVSDELLRLGLRFTADLIQHVNVAEDRQVWHGDVDGLLGYDPKEFPRSFSGWFELIHPDDVGRVRESMERVMAEDLEGWCFRYRIRAGDGKYRHWLDRGIVVGHLDGRPNEGIGGIIDETEQVLARQELERALVEAREQGALSNMLLHTIPDSVAYLDPDGTIRAVTEAWNKFGRQNDAAPGNYKGANYLDVCRRAAADDPDVKLTLDGLQSVLNGSREAFEQEYPCHSPSQKRWFSLEATAVPDGEGCVVVHRNVTEQVEQRNELERTVLAVGQVRDRLDAEANYLREEIAAEHDVGGIVGASEAIARVLHRVEMVAPTDATVLLLGETGTGKEMLARAIHRTSGRRDRPLIKVDCGALPAGLIESELFGHEKGAFTGAHRSKPGRFELANRGTLFLDEVGELPLELQSRLLRVLDEGEMRRVGGTSEIRLDVRVIAATNRDLREEVRLGRFRPDLYYRLSVFPISVPPLRERREDIPPLASLFTNTYARSMGKHISQLAQASVDALMAYDWPGNVRELRNVIERSVILCGGNTLRVQEVLGGTAATESGFAPRRGNLAQALQDLERARITQALEESDWRIKGEGNAASRLGVTASGVRSRMKKLGITRPE